MPYGAASTEPGTALTANRGDMGCDITQPVVTVRGVTMGGGFEKEPAKHGPAGDDADKASTPAILAPASER